ncbi:MAG: hypothetical protein ABR968_06345 [Bacteroidales bacterium]|jgi:hypothetical protein
MKKHFILLTALLTFAVASYAQDIILHKGNEKAVITKGKVIGITLKGEEYKYKDWEHVYKTNNYIRQNLWEVDDMGPDSIYLSGYDYTTTYTNKAILRMELKDSLKYKDYIIDSIIPSESGRTAYDSLFCRIVETTLNGQVNKAVNYNDIESFTFARKDMNAFKDANGNIDFSINVSANLSGHVYHSEGPVHYATGHIHHGGGGHIHVGNGKGEIIALLVILSVGVAVEVTALIIDDIETEVHTYYLNDWKVEVK